MSLTLNVFWLAEVFAVNDNIWKGAELENAVLCSIH